MKPVRTHLGKSKFNVVIKVLVFNYMDSHVMITKYLLKLIVTGEFWVGLTSFYKAL